MRKTKHWLVTATLLLCSISVSAHDFEVDGIYYNITSSTDLTVEVTYQGSSYSEYTNRYTGRITVPSSVMYEGNTYSVVKVGANAFYNCVNLIAVSLSEGITSIGTYAMSGCTALSTVTLPISLTDIGYSAFWRSSSLLSIVIPKNVKSVGSMAFAGCSGLVSIEVDENNTTYDSRNNCNAIINTNGNKLIVGCSTTIIPESVKSIGRLAFDGQSKLTSMSIPEGIVSLEYGAFRACTSLVSVVIPQSLKSIDAAFNGCNSLVSIDIPEGVVSINGAAFHSCSSLKSINLPKNLKSLGDAAFEYCSSLTSITIPKSITSIGRSTFRFCTSLVSVDMPDGLTSIGNDAFAMCASLKNVNIPKSVTSIASGAFQETALVSITLPDNLTVIGDALIRGCNNLTAIVIPKNIESIGEWVFNGCSNLTTIISEAITPPICESSYTFEGLGDNVTLYVPPVSVSAYKQAEYWSDFSTIEAVPIKDLQIEDGEGFSQVIEQYCASITYTRTFNNTNWQALYVPFEIPYENIKDDFEVAYINDTRQYDRDDDGVKEETVIEAFKITSGTLEANYPYLIRAKEAGEKAITVTDAILYATEENSIDCSSVYDKYTFTGTYSRMSSTELTGCYALSGGVWQPIAEGATLGAFRFYLQVESRNGSAQAAQSIKMRVIGEETDDEATSIDDMESADNEQIVYDLAGRRVANPTKGVYIVNGKKVLYN